MALDNNIKEWLDRMSDEELIFFIDFRFGIDEPVWEECSKEEYEEWCDKTYAENDFERSLKILFDNEMYKRVPVYSDWKGGIINLLKLQEEKEPDAYRYYRMTGNKRVFLMGSDMIEYCQTRECMKPYFKQT